MDKSYFEESISEIRDELAATCAEFDAIRQERAVALAQLAAVTQQRDALREAVEQTLAFIESDAEALDATCDNWPCVKAARAALALVRGE